MALSAVSAAEMKTFFQENRVPENVITWLQELCMIESMADFVGVLRSARLLREDD